MFALPPVGSANTSPHTLQPILLTALLKMSCSLPHFWHFTRRKTLLGFGMSLFQSDIFFSPISFILWLVFLDGCRLCDACNCRLCILGARSVFWLFLRIHVATRIFGRHNPLSRVRGAVHHELRHGVFQVCRELQRESDELYILDSKSLLLWERSRFQPALHKRNIHILILYDF